ncbi:hypothetical protein [Glutamicibacter mishrai]|uniref:hypothetical protein n=1 Tax=Glutamicibacter mishrai TaxID=1775880 RepID=UPI003F7A8DDA
MAKSIDGVPETISQEELTSFVSHFGFKPEDLSNLNVSPEGVTAVVFERNEDGSRKLNSNGINGYVKHVIRIPIEN